MDPQLVQWDAYREDQQNCDVEIGGRGRGAGDIVFLARAHLRAPGYQGTLRLFRIPGTFKVRGVLFGLLFF